jgi:hypothetical protein
MTIGDTIDKDYDAACSQNLRKTIGVMSVQFKPEMRKRLEHTHGHGKKKRSDQIGQMVEASSLDEAPFLEGGAARR